MRFFQSEAQPRMEAVGMTVIGAFASLSDPVEFVYVRTFDSIEQREVQYQAFYGSEDWLGWMIDEAAGNEESFEAFLGVDEPDAVSLADLPSGIHLARVNVSLATGVIVSCDREWLAVQTSSRITTFRLGPAVLVSRTPTRRGMQPALEASIDELIAGCPVLVLADDTTGAEPLALQVVRRE